MRIALFLAALAFTGAAAASDDATTRIGGNVEITDAVAGDLNVVGGNVTVEAPVSGSVHAVGGHVVINAPVGGDATIVAGSLELGAEARIAGKLNFRGGDLQQDPAAEVSGPIEKTSGRPRHEYRYAHGWGWTAGLLVLAALIAAALPGPSRRMATELQERPWLTTLVGFIALVTIPVAAVLLLVTIIGIPLGLLAMAGYAALLLVGYVWLAVVAGGLLLARIKPETAALTAWRAGAAALAMLAIALLALIPIVGGFVVAAALVVGVGMIVAAFMRRKTPPQGEPALV